MVASNPPAPAETLSNRSGSSFLPTEIPSLTTLFRIALLLSGTGLLISGLCQNWFDIPVPKNNLANDDHQISRVAPTCQPVFQVITGIGLGCLLVLQCIRKRWSTLCTLIACSMILVGLAFPWFVMLRSPEIAADAAWLQMQHDNLTWLGGDINTAAESGQKAWKSKVYFVDPPRQIAVAPLPGWSAWQVGLDKLDDILVWLGYSNVFCQFARPGWFHSLIGSVLLMLISLTGPAQLNVRRAGFAILYSFVMILAGVVFAMQGPFGAKPTLQRAMEATGRGDYQQAREQLELCGRQFPVLRQDTYFIRQLGLIEFRLQRSTDHARLYQATEHDSYGRYEQAFQIWRSLCDSEDAAIKREALRAVQRFATQDYNAGRLIPARERLELVLQHQPANVKAVYFLQILAIRENDSAEVYRLCDWMYAITEHLNFSTTKVLKAVSQQNAAVAAAQRGDADETWLRMIGAKKP